MRIPQHVAIILDGNGRWAKSKGMPRNYGHTMGAKNVEVICEDAYHMGIQYLDAVCVFYRELEPSGYRGRSTDEASCDLFKELYQKSR